MQDQSADLSSDAARLERLRLLLQCTWADLGKRIGLSESMIYQVKSGARQLSPKAQHRLLVAERDCALPTDFAVFKAGTPKDTTGSLSGRLALLESDPGAWGDEMDSATLVAHIRLAELLKASQELASLSSQAADEIETGNPDLAANLRDAIQKNREALRRGHLVKSDFFDGLTMLVSQVPEWLRAALEAKKKRGR